MKRFIPLLVIYVLVHMPSGNRVREYEGQSQETITSLLQGEGVTGDFVTQKQYQAFLDAHHPNKTPDPIKVQAKIDLNTMSKTDAERINAIIKYLDLDK